MKKLMTLVVAAVGISAFAAEINYIGSPTNCEWKVGSNWEGGVAPGAADIGVFDLGDGTYTNILFVNQAEINGVKVLSGQVALGQSRTQAVEFRGDANGDAYVHVADGATLLFSNMLYSAVNGGVRLIKTGAGNMKTVAVIAPRNWYFSTFDIREGYVGGADGYNGLAKQTNVIVRAGAKYDFTQYSFVQQQNPVHVDTADGGTLRFYSDWLDGVCGNGILEGYSSYGLGMYLQEGPYVFGGKVLLRNGETGDEVVTLSFGPQGTASDEKYGFVLAATNALRNAQIVKFEEGGINPIKFAPGVGQFDFFQLSSKKDAPLMLQDTNGAPVTVRVHNLGSAPGLPKSDTVFKYFGVEGPGNFVSLGSGAWRYEVFPFTNDVFRNTGWIGTTGKMTLGDGTEGHDVVLSHISGVKTLASGATLYYRNCDDCTQPGFLENAGTTYFKGPGKMTVEGPVSGAGTLTIDAPVAFDNTVALDGGKANVNAETEFNGKAGGTFVLNAATTFAEDLEDSTVTVNYATTFERYVKNCKFTISQPTTFADDVTDSTFTINATTAFEGDVRRGTFTINAATDFSGRLEATGQFRANQPTAVRRLVTSEGNLVNFVQLRDLLVGADGKDAWVSKFDSFSPQSGTLVLSNGVFHSAYAEDDFTSIDLYRPGIIQIGHPKMRLDNASVWVDFGGSAVNDLTLAPGGIFYPLWSAKASSGRVTFDGGEYRVHLGQSYGHDWIPADGNGYNWTFYVTERGGRICEDTWHMRGGDGGWVRPNIHAAFASGAAEGHAAGELKLAFKNQVNIARPLTTGGDIAFESGRLIPDVNSYTTAAMTDGTFFGTNNLSLGCAALDFGSLGSDYAPKFASREGQKINLKAPVMIRGRTGGNAAQTFTFGDGKSNPFVREKGAFLVISDNKAGTAHFDGTGVKAYVNGAKLPVDATTRILKDPIFGQSYFYSDFEICRYDFLTQDVDGLLKYDESVYTEGVEGGATTVARVSAATTLSADAQVAALNLDGYPLTIGAGATLKVGQDATDYPAVVLTHHSKASWGGDPCGNINGKGTLDFGASEGLIVAGRGDRTYRGCSVNCRITGTGGVSFGGVTRQVSCGGVLDISGSNDYTGGTRISGVELRVRNANALSTGPIRVYGGEYNGGRARLIAAGTYANEWFCEGSGAYVFAVSGFEPGCITFNAEVTLTGPVHVDGMARFSTSPATSDFTTGYGYTSGTGIFAGEISGGEVQIVGSHPSSKVKKPIVFTHHNSYTGGTMMASQDLILRGDGDCGTGKVTLANSAKLTFENTADKTFPNVIEGKGWVKLAGSAPVHFTGGVKRESWCDVKLDLADTNPVFTEAPAFGTVTNTASATARMTLQGSMTLDPAGYDWFDPNVRVKVDGGTVDLCGGTLSVERVELRNGGKFVNGKVVQSNPAKGLVIIFR